MGCSVEVQGVDVRVWWVVGAVAGVKGCAYVCVCARGCGVWCAMCGVQGVCGVWCVVCGVYQSAVEGC